MIVRPLALWPAFLLLTACVTINIYFPAAAAEKAADVIIKDIIDSRAATPVPEPEAALEHVQPVWLGYARPVIDWLVPPAQAAAADLNVQSAAIGKIRASMKQRFGQLKPHFDSGAIGFAADGRVALRDVSGLPLAQRAKLNGLIAAENRDRDALYKEIARANDHPDWETQIRSTFAARWASNASAGWWYEDSTGWHQK